MKYRRLGKTGIEVSALGFGAMRLPTSGSEAEIDEPAAVALLREAIDRGVNYIDTAYPYHGGNSETVVGRALGDGYREKVLLATKLPIWKVENAGDFERFLSAQLARLRTDYVDFYLLHSLQEKSWERMQQLEVCQWAERVRRDGRIRCFGFSFHDTFEAFKKIVDAYDWPFCQIQYNIVNENVQAGTRGLKYAAGKGMGVIVMEPLFGGTLANPPQSIWEIWQESGQKPVDVALRWLWDQPEVSLVLSGMSTATQLRENLDSADRSDVGWFDEQERKLVECVQRQYEQLAPIPCTKCGYCLPCPEGVNIPINFELYNNATVFQGNSRTLARNLYHSLPETQRAGHCKRCGECETVCPQSIEISEQLKRVAATFA